MNRTTSILLLRHGQTDANASGVLQGHQPTPLNLLGTHQATLLAARLKSFRPPIEMLISSDLPRAIQTAGPIAAACGLPVRIDPQRRERGFGLLEGKPVGDKEMWRAASGEMDPPGAELTEEMHQRVRAALLRLAARHGNVKVIAVVTHGGPIRGVLKMLGDGRLPTTRGHRAVPIAPIANCSIMQLLVRRYRNGVRWRLACINDSAHLADVVSDRDSG